MTCSSGVIRRIAGDGYDVQTGFDRSGTNLDISRLEMPMTLADSPAGWTE